MNMLLLTGLSIGLALSIMNANNFYANNVTTTSIKQATDKIESIAVLKDVNQYSNGSYHYRWSNNYISDAYHWMRNHLPNR